MKQLAIIILILAAPLAFLFQQQLFHHDYTGFSNDGPLGTQVAQQAALPESITGVWEDLNYLGRQDPSLMNPSAGLRLICENAAVFAIVVMTPLAFIALRWGLIWSVVWLNVAQAVFVVGFGLGMICGWIDPYDTWCWMILPVGEIIFIPSTIIVLYELEDRRDHPLEGLPSWTDIKNMRRDDWLIFAFIISIPTIHDPMMKWITK